MVCVCNYQKTSLNPSSFPVAESRSTAIVLCMSDCEVVNRESGRTSLIHSLGETKYNYKTGMTHKSLRYNSDNFVDKNFRHFCHDETVKIVLVHVQCTYMHIRGS